MKEFFQKFKDIEAKKTILIVDDLENMVERYQSAAEGFDLDIHVAYGVEEAIKIAQQIKPDYAILDKDMPDGSGNQVAEAIKKANPEARIAGFTGGDPQDFKSEYFDIRESKVSEEKAKEIIKILIESKDAKIAYHGGAPTGELRQAIHHLTFELMVPLDVLVQGYDMLKKAHELEQPTGYDGLPNLTLAEVREFREKGTIVAEANPEVMLEDIKEIFPDGVAKKYKDTIMKIDQLIPQVDGKVARGLRAFKDSAEIKEFIQDLEKQDFKAIGEKKQYVIFHEKYVGILEAMK